MLKVVVPVKEEILRAAERRKAVGVGEDIAQFLAELINLGFEYRLRRLYRRFDAGEISAGSPPPRILCQRPGVGRA